MEQFTIEPLLSSQSEGELPAMLAPELWVKAHREKFNGTLALLMESTEQVFVQFVSGSSVRVQSELDLALAQDCLTEHLPPEQLQLVDVHCKQFGVDALSAVERLRLLPSPILARVHFDCMMRELCRLMAMPTPLHFVFQPGHNCFRCRPGFSHPVDNLPLLADALLQADDLSWYHGRLASRRRDPLRLCGSAAQTKCEYHGLLRQVVHCLRRKEESFESLSQVQGVHEDALAAIVYALRATGCIKRTKHRLAERPTTAIRFKPSAERLAFSDSEESDKWQGAKIPAGGLTPRPSASAGRTSTSGIQPIDLAQGLPPSSRPSSAGPPRSAPAAPPSGSPHRTAHTPKTTSEAKSTRANSNVGAQSQQAVESSALGAWMRAMDHPSCRQKALDVVEAAHRTFPENPRILFYLGCLLALAKRNGEAEAAMLRVLELDPEHLEAKRELSRISERDTPHKERSPFGRWGNRKSV